MISSSGQKGPVTMKLAQLQNLCKRDPEGYIDDYQSQLLRFNSEVQILELNPSSANPRFIELMQFITAVVSSSYRSDSESVAQTVMSLLSNKSNNLHSEIRLQLVKSLILMRNRAVVKPTTVQTLFCNLLSVQDKALRAVVYAHIISDVKALNKKSKDEKNNRSLQSYMHKIVEAAGREASTEKGSSTIDLNEQGKVKRLVDIASELYRKRIWTDDRTVSLLATASTSPIQPVMVRSIKFFLMIEDVMDDDKEREENDEWAGVNNIDFHQHSKKTISRKKQVHKQIENRKKAMKRRQNRDDDETQINQVYPAIEQLNDPHGLAAKLLKKVRAGGNGLKFETKLLVINFITRLVGVHKLLLLPLYPFLQRYLTGHQANITKLLAYVVQASHDQVPPDELKGILKVIASEFITERCSEEQMAVGINTCRAILARVPALLTEEEGHENDGGGSVLDIEAFVRDVCGFGRHRDKSVSVAAKGFTNFIRETQPKLLQGKHRGLVGTGVMKGGEEVLKYGEVRTQVGVEGAELLVEYERMKKEKREKMRNMKEEKTSSKGGDESEEEEGDWEEVEEEEEEGDADDDEDDEEEEEGEWEDVADSDDDPEEAPKLVETDQMKIRAETSQNRIFSSAELNKIKKLVAREKAMRRDPRLAAKRKRMEAAGEADLLSGDELGDSSDSDLDNYESDEEEDIATKRNVTPGDIMAESKRRRLNKMERLESIKKGREEMEFKKRAGGSTNTEKKRKKNFLMQRQSWERRRMDNDKQTRSNGAGRKAKNFASKFAGAKGAGKRRRK
ncbi:hypothetical protein TrLO_g15633 [Triparma laevis f. longispina]|uniref:Protein SDA1 n=1 Tax=Triparma laevis f. longispina TaxID=1714387 RepID=A0A9W7FRD7_9STRA|nr:hypothetical protein TrLO_g15633 [Triparma laevis f. longispina]